MFVFILRQNNKRKDIQRDYEKTGWIISLVVAVVVAFGAGVVVGNSGILHKNTENVSKTASVDEKRAIRKMVMKQKHKTKIRKKQRIRHRRKSMN